jgi:hydroxymethylglutaryl-CoA synthase
MGCPASYVNTCLRGLGLELQRRKSMAGIVSCGAYVPLFRLGRGTTGWESPTERAIANYDEDSVTMAVAALRDALRAMDPGGIDALYFASTTQPYA